MGLADDLAAIDLTPPTRKVEWILEQLGDADRDALVAALINPGITHVAIADALTGNGFPVDPKSVARWRRANGAG